MSTILVLGGGGFIAGHIEQLYHALGWRVVSIGRAVGLGPGERHVWSLPHPEFAHLLAVERPDVCVNAAGRASVAASLVEPLTDFEASTALTFRLLDDLRRASPATVYIHLSSAAVYGEARALPIAENAAIAPISPYGWHKHFSEQALAEHSAIFGLRTASLRIFSAYGPTLHRQVVWDLAAKARPGAPLKAQGCADDSRDFIHGQDVAQALALVVDKGVLDGACYNVASGVETRIDALAALVARCANAGEITFNQLRRPGDPSRWRADISRLAALGFAPRIALAEGVRQVVSAAHG